jgi:hypothetical protein
MSFHVFFDFSSGLAETLMVPKGTLDAIIAHVREVESAFGLETEQYRDNPPHWKTTKPTKQITDDNYCDLASSHNDWLRRLYRSFGEWSKSPVSDGEQLAPAHHFV